jgi:osmotically-inducible protein OsmY
MADARDSDVPEAKPEGGQQSPDMSGGPAPIGTGQGYARDFGGGGLNQGADGSRGQGYGGSLGASDYRQSAGGEAYGGGMSSADYARSHGPRGEDIASDTRSWMDERAENNMRGRGPHHGRGPANWRRSDERIHEDVCERLTEDRLIDARHIEVAVRDGVVTLSGEAMGATDPRRAEQVARQATGVTDVRVELTVRQGGGSSMPRQPGEDDGRRTDRSPMGYPILPT